ncbi:MAG: hypothetical protein JWQ42_2017 [Edaphobacter sp.]|nr:hypothetical protein [Edaphobacter sp.]
MRTTPFSRPTIVAAAEALESCTQGAFDQIILRLTLELIVPLGPQLSVAKKCSSVARAVLAQPASTIQTLDGPQTLSESLIREAVAKCSMTMENPLEARLRRGLGLDGFVPVWDERDRRLTIRAALPELVGFIGVDDELHELLRSFTFMIPEGHLTQAVDAHARGDWAAANSQIRTFLESLLDEIAIRWNLDPAGSLTSENRRSALANIGFLSHARNEWSSDGKNYINGLFKMLHTEGSHPGLSDEDHCTFRLQVVLITSRMILRRFKLRQ